MKGTQERLNKNVLLKPLLSPNLQRREQFEHHIMEDKPVVVIRGNIPKDLRKFYKAAVEKGSGGEEDRK